MLKVLGGWVWVVYNKFWGSFNAGTLSFSHDEGGGGGTTGFGVVSMQALEVLDMLKGGGATGIHPVKGVTQGLPMKLMTVP